MASNRKTAQELKSTANDDNIIKRPLEEVMHESIIPYAEYVIMERALPRVEDGLKPVQRRILYSMYELGLLPDKPHRKSARIVGDTLGKYHPHGDSSVYDAMVRMAQDFNMRALLVDGHGNFGSIDGDAAAAMRYTEARLTPLAMEMLRDIEKDTVRFSLNFDDTLKEPDMLPARFPNVLVNGSSGIAVGVATNIPPHNLGEAVDAVIAQMENPDISLDKLLKIMPGPDFPTGGIIIGQDEIKNAYETGRGKFFLRAKVDIEDAPGGKKLLVIKELPYQVNKAALLGKILKLAEEKKGILSGISDIRDESDRAGIRAVIELKKDADPEMVLNYLYRYSDLQISFGINMVVIADGKPQQLGLKSILEHYIRHQKDVVIRRTKYDLEKARAREHILEGFMIALQNIDEVIAIIRSSESPAKARTRLVKRFDLSQLQAQAILDMRLQRLTGLEISNLKKEYEEVKKLINKLEDILASERTLVKVIKRELLDIKKKYADPRRTRLVEDVSEAEISSDDLVYVEDSVITLTHDGYIKRIPLKSYNRSSRDVESVETREGDYVEFVVESATDHRVLLITDKGNCHAINCKSLPEGKWRDKGIYLHNLVNSFDEDERPVAVISVKEFSENRFIQFYTTMGMIKRTPLSEYNARKAKIQACSLKDGDKLVGAELTDGQKDVIFITRLGMSIRFPGSEVPVVGRVAIGVKGIRLKNDDSVIFGGEIDDEGEIMTVTDRGFVKRTLAADYQPQGRGGVGYRTIRFARNRSNGSYLVASFYVKEPYEIMLQQKDGTTTGVETESIPIEERDGKGQPAVLVLMDNEICAAYRNYKDL
ncbi:MAG: DNA gyrase subunit A [Clostridiales bacterium]|jgi:DNA gyrase subunit A|nr:DNA gyrase subunit A [Clostridiales bacterium]